MTLLQNSQNRGFYKDFGLASINLHAILEGQTVEPESRTATQQKSPRVAGFFVSASARYA
jgi:hypothetical protein